MIMGHLVLKKRDQEGKLKNHCKTKIQQSSALSPVIKRKSPPHLHPRSHPPPPLPAGQSFDYQFCCNNRTILGYQWTALAKARLEDNCSLVFLENVTFPMNPYVRLCRLVYWSMFGCPSAGMSKFLKRTPIGVLVSSKRLAWIRGFERKSTIHICKGYNIKSLRK